MDDMPTAREPSPIGDPVPPGELREPPQELPPSAPTEPEDLDDGQTHQAASKPLI